MVDKRTILLASAIFSHHLMMIRSRCRAVRAWLPRQYSGKELTTKFKQARNITTPEKEKELRILVWLVTHFMTHFTRTCKEEAEHDEDQH
jgi:hypothetical protein